MDWVALIMALLEVLGPLLANCFSPDEAGVKMLRRSLGRAYLTIYREARNLDMSHADARKMAHERVQELREATDDELLQLLQDAHTNRMS